MFHTVGRAIVYAFTCTRRVNGAEQLYDPTTVSCSFLHADGTEDVVVYAGVDPGDDTVTRLSTGAYEVSYVPPYVEKLRLRVRTTDVVGSHEWPGKTREEVFDIQADPHAYTDIPAAAP